MRRMPRSGQFFHLQNEHLGNATPIGCPVLCSHNLGHTVSAPDRLLAPLPPTEPEGSHLPLDLYPKSPVLSPAHLRGAWPCPPWTCSCQTLLICH